MRILTFTVFIHILTVLLSRCDAATTYSNFTTKIIGDLTTGPCTETKAAVEAELNAIGADMDAKAVLTGVLTTSAVDTMKDWQTRLVNLGKTIRDSSTNTKIKNCLLLYQCYVAKLVCAITQALRILSTKSGVLSAADYTSLFVPLTTWTTSAGVCMSNQATAYAGHLQEQYDLYVQLKADSCLFAPTTGVEEVLKIGFDLAVKSCMGVTPLALSVVNGYQTDNKNMWQSVKDMASGAAAGCKTKINCYSGNYATSFTNAKNTLATLTAVSNVTHYDNYFGKVADAATNNKVCLVVPAALDPLASLPSSFSSLQSSIPACSSLSGSAYTTAITSLTARWQSLKGDLSPQDITLLTCADLGDACKMGMMAYKASRQTALLGVDITAMFQGGISRRTSECAAITPLTATQILVAGPCNLRRSDISNISDTVMSAVIADSSFMTSVTTSGCDSKPNLKNALTTRIKSATGISGSTLTCANAAANINYMGPSDIDKLSTTMCTCSPSVLGSMFDGQVFNNNPQSCRDFIRRCSLRFTPGNATIAKQCKFALSTTDFITQPNLSECNTLGWYCTKADLSNVKSKWLRRYYRKFGMKSSVCALVKAGIPATITAGNFAANKDYIAELSTEYVRANFSASLITTNIISVVTAVSTSISTSFNPTLAYILRTANIASEPTLCGLGYGITGFTSARQIIPRITTAGCCDDLTFRLRPCTRSGRHRGIARVVLRKYRSSFSGVLSLTKCYAYVNQYEYISMSLSIRLKFAIYMSPYMGYIDVSVGRAVYIDYVNYFGGASLVTSTFVKYVGAFGVYGTITSFKLITKTVRIVLFAYICDQPHIRKLMTVSTLRYVTSQYLTAVPGTTVGTTIDISVSVTITQYVIPEMYVCGMTIDLVNKIAALSDIYYFMDAYSMCRIDDTIGGAIVLKLRALGGSLLPATCGDYCIYMTNTELQITADFGAGLTVITENMRRKISVQEKCALILPNECTSAVQVIYEQRVYGMCANFARRSLSISASLRKRRAAQPWTCYTLAVMGGGVTALTAAEINSTSNVEFKACVNNFGEQDHLWSTEQATALKDKLTDAAVYGSTYSSWSNADMLSAKCLLGVLGDTNVASLKIDSIQVIEALGECSKMPTTTMAAIVTKYISSLSPATAASLTSDELSVLGALGCGMTSAQVTLLNPTIIANSLGRLQQAGPCFTPLATSFVAKLKDASALGAAVASWSAEVIGELGPLFNGLSTTDIQSLSPEQLQSIATTQLTMISPEKLNALSVDQMKTMGSQQLGSISSTQQAGLDADKLEVIKEAGGEDIDHRSGAFSTTSPHIVVTLVCAIIPAIRLLA